MDSIVEMIFGKKIHAIELDDLTSYFSNEQRETDVIEFKSYVDYAEVGTKANRDKEKLDDVIRTICGFLNSEGGLLIWGAPIGKSPANGKEKIFQGELTKVAILVEPDQFINKISSQISPIPSGTLFKAIKIDDDGYCYVFEIKKSDYSPHQYRGTYYMRLDGSTRIAPHHYVEALIKRISYPRLQAYLNFGIIRDYSDVAGIPVQITIHNLSKFINEKNVQYRILVTGGDIVEVNKIWQSMQQAYQSDITKKAHDLLHYNMPYFFHFMLITDRLLQRSSKRSITIMLSVWGELSPVITSSYKLEVFEDSGSVKTSYQIIEKSENLYLYELSDKNDLSERERLDQSRNLLLENFQNNIHETSIFKQLHKKF